jgi:hypothetical protein
VICSFVADAVLVKTARVIVIAATKIVRALTTKIEQLVGCRPVVSELTSRALPMCSASLADCLVLETASKGQTSSNHKQQAASTEKKTRRFGGGGRHAGVYLSVVSTVLT